MSLEKVRAAFASGNAVFTDQNNAGLLTLDGNLRAVVIPAGSAIFGAPQNQRFHVTVAQVNAGLDLLPAIVGYKYRLIDATLIAVGGAAATATAVIITGVQAASTVSLLSVAVAALTQSAVVKPNTANATVLADGASYAQNDAASKIAIGKTGGTLATATHIDVLLTYAIEA